MCLINSYIQGTGKCLAVIALILIAI